MNNNNNSEFRALQKSEVDGVSGAGWHAVAVLSALGISLGLGMAMGPAFHEIRSRVDRRYNGRLRRRRR